MPIYEYQCQSCGHQLEVLQKMNSDPLRECPKCGTLSLEKQISQSGFALKGSGWYETDFKSKPKKEAESAPKKAESNT
jgi:putative FmdB family regulatory protein